MAITLLTISDIQEYEPDILNYGIPDFDNEQARAQQDVFRDLRIKYWPTQVIGLYDAKYITGANQEPDDDLYTASQLTRVAVFQCLGYHIYPKLAKFEPDQDIFERKMYFYREEYSREFEKVLQDGVEYDLDSSGTVSDREKEPTSFLRLKR
jgi:hypothetical protein